MFNRACFVGSVSLVIGLTVPSMAFADIYGFVDDQGVTHFAPEPIDPRYQLFFKEGQHPADVAPQRGSASGSGELMQTRLFHRVVDEPNVQKFELLIVRVAKEQGADPALVKSVIATESAFDPNAVSTKGAVGLMQVLPETAMRYGLAADKKHTVAQKLCDPTVNLRIGTHYLQDLRAMFKNLPLALAAYNSGENTVKRFNNQIPPFPETVAYVKVVQEFLSFYQPVRSPYLDSQRLHITLPARRNLPSSLSNDSPPLLIPDRITDSVIIQTIP
jgi:hypothetical protein